MTQMSLVSPDGVDAKATLVPSGEMAGPMLLSAGWPGTSTGLVPSGAIVQMDDTPPEFTVNATEDASADGTADAVGATAIAR
jgi:hypothetical protein